jgi:hypothetical protein
MPTITAACVETIAKATNAVLATRMMVVHTCLLEEIKRAIITLFLSISTRHRFVAVYCCLLAVGRGNCRFFVSSIDIIHRDYYVGR